MTYSEACRQVDIIQDIVTKIRRLRSKYGLSWKESLDITVLTAIGNDFLFKEWHLVDCLTNCRLLDIIYRFNPGYRGFLIRSDDITI